MSVDDKWQEIHGGREWGKYPNEHVVAFVMKTFGRAADRQAVRILDLGFGGGGNLKFLCEQGFQASGIEGAPPAVARTEAFLASHQLSGELHAGDMTDLSMFPDDHFNLVIDVRSMSNVPRAEVDTVVAEVRRVLMPGGYFLTLLYGTGCMDFARGRQLTSQTFTDVPTGPFQGIGHVTVYDIPGVRTLLKDFSIMTHHRIREEEVAGNWSFEDHFVVCRKV